MSINGSIDHTLGALEAIGDQAGLFKHGVGKVATEAGLHDQLLRQWAVDRSIGIGGHVDIARVIRMANALYGYVKGGELVDSEGAA